MSKEERRANPLDVVKPPFPFETLADDLRRKVLEFLLAAPPDAATSTLRALKSTGAPFFRNKFPRVPESATMALRTLMHHTRTIKAVSKEVCADVRILEKTVVKPEKWLEGLWLVEAGTRSQGRGRGWALAHCLARSLIAGRANTVVDLYSRMTVDPHFHRHLGRTAFKGFVDGLRTHEWTLLVTDVTLKYKGGELEDLSDDDYETQQRPTAAQYDALDAGLAAFFGEETMRRAPWVHAWCNGPHAIPWDQDEFATASDRVKQTAYAGHDSSRPPLTRIRDAHKNDLLTLGHLQLAGASTFVRTDKPLLSAATFDVTFAPDAWSAEQHDNDEPPNAPPGAPSYVFIQPVSLLKCRGGGECEFLDDVMLKIKTATHPDAKALDEVLLWVPIVEGVFNAFCECTFVGLN